ncbi:hypothetical protein EJD97_018733 [Solanum chilense]|uniref:Post-SET domain-containing protein n=1 Tax=Solanum chilense TaxID=4083 RepID=A0A6N2B328_SOLCI|nr:hypothetical protein EJD97_018733 [Solanum chilense]
MILCVPDFSSQPNCETRKWIVLGETRWYGGARVRCRCGAANCSLFLGAESQGFKGCNHVWEEGDNRYIVDNIPLYDTTDDDESTPAISGTSGGNKHTKVLNDGEGSMLNLEPTHSATKKKSQRKPKDVTRCEQCPDAVREEMIRYVDQKKEEKRQALLQSDVSKDMEEGEASG